MPGSSRMEMPTAETDNSTAGTRPAVNGCSTGLQQYAVLCGWLWLWLAVSQIRSHVVVIHGVV